MITMYYRMTRDYKIIILLSLSRGRIKFVGLYSTSGSGDGKGNCIGQFRICCSQGYGDSGLTRRMGLSLCETGRGKWRVFFKGLASLLPGEQIHVEPIRGEMIVMRSTRQDLFPVI
jgi:hypothetical protein